MIAQIRQLKGMSLTEVAAATSTTKSQIQKLEKGERRLTLDWMERSDLSTGFNSRHRSGLPDILYHRN